jgi:hypothetical protein
VSNYSKTSVLLASFATAFLFVGLFLIVTSIKNMLRTFVRVLGPAKESDVVNTGNCADLSPREKGTNAKPGNSDKDPWNKLCSSLAKQGIDVLVELIDISGCGHKPSKPTNATGPHYHVSLKSGGGSGGSTQSSIPGVRSWQGNPPASGSLTAHRYQDGDWSNTDPDLKAAFDQLKQKYSPLTTGQVYRPQGYADHMRSIWEAYN